MSSNNQRGEKVLIIGTKEFLDYNPFKGIYKKDGIIGVITSNQRILDSHNKFMHNYNRKHSKLFYEAQEQLFREYPVLHAGLVEYEESLEIMEYVINEDKVDFGLVFMFHCFNVLLEEGELP